MRWLCFLLLAPGAHAFEPASVDVIQKALTRAIRTGQTPGAVLWMERGADARHWAQGERAQSPAREPMTEDTVFDAASLTKVVATLPSVMLLVDRGLVELQAPAQRYLPELASTAITVQHLLTHTSGLPPGIPRDIANPDWQGYAEGIRRATACLPDPPPAHVFRYSDVNFILLGEIVRRVSGQPLDVFAKVNVFGPLGMTSTGYNPALELLPRIAPTERDEKGSMLRGVVHDPTARRMGGVAGHAGLFTTAGDLARYARCMLRGEVDGVRLLSRDARMLMTTPQTPVLVYERRGLGWDMDSRYSRPRGAVFPLGGYGHTGWTGTAMWLDPATDSFYILLTTRLHPDGKGNVRDLYEEIGTAVAKAAGVKPGMEPTFWPRAEKEVPTVLNGIDVLKRQGFAPLKGLRLGLITNHTGLDNERQATIDTLAKAPGLKLMKLYSPEHGIRGELDQEKIDDTRDAKTGLPVVSLYTDKKRVPTAQDMEGIDAMVFDIQDIGCRFYTYIATLKNCLEAAAQAGKAFIVLDRVNPIRGDFIEGPSEVAKTVFTAIHPIPLRHGMTAGELARMFVAEDRLNVDLRVVEVQGWQRAMWFDATGLPWRNPSPNMRNLNAATLYPGIGLLEFAISVGRGTDTPFEVLGAPYTDDLRLAHELNALGLPAIRFVPERFTPTASVFAGKACGGVRLIITDRDRLRPVELGLAIGHTLHRLYPKEFDMEKYNTLLNHPASIAAIKAGQSWKSIAAVWAQQVTAFELQRRPYLLY